MPTNIIRPVAAGNWTNSLTLGAGGSIVAAVDPGDPVTHDDDTSYIRGELSANYSFQITNVPTAFAVVVDYTVGIRSKNFSGEPNNVKGYARSGSTNAAAAVTNSTADSVWYTTGPTTSARPGGGNWGVSDFVESDNTTQLAVEHNGNATLNVPRTSSLWGELEYLPPAGGFTFLIGQWMPWIAGLYGVMDYSQIVSMFRSMPEMAHYKHGVPSLREDFEAIREALRRRPVYGI